MARWLHLVARFVEVVTARPLAPEERRRVLTLLRPGPETEAYFAQSVADQRHGFAAADTVARQAPERRDLQRAALLHDIGKRRSGLGAIGRVVATLTAQLGGPWGRRHLLYRDHGPLGAAELEAWGAEPIVVAYARHHHDERPDGMDAADWALLVWADGGERRRLRGTSR